MRVLVIGSRYIHVAQANCSECERATDRLLRCTNPPKPCDAQLCWRCWVDKLERHCGGVRCACGSAYGGAMSRFDCDEFQNLWVTKFGYGSWEESEKANLRMLPRNSLGRSPNVSPPGLAHFGAAPSNKFMP